MQKLISGNITLLKGLFSICDCSCAFLKTHTSFKATTNLEFGRNWVEGGSVMLCMRRKVQEFLF